MTAITWKINNLECQTSDGLVTVVHWSASAVDGSGSEEVSASIVNTQAIIEQMQTRLAALEGA